MAIQVILPKQGLQMTEGLITKWLVQEGQRIEADAPLFEMETDKLNIEINSPASGTLLKILRQEGETVPITEVIALIGEPGEDLSGLPGAEAAAPNAAAQDTVPQDAANRKASAPDGTAQKAAPQVAVGTGSSGRVFITPRAKAEAAARGVNVAALRGTGPGGLIIARDVAASRARATPLAAKLAQQEGIKLEDVPGTGARGKITRDDISAALAAKTRTAAAAAAGSRPDKLIPLSGMRKTIAGRMLQSLQEMAQANHRMKVDMSEVIRFREKLKDANLKVSFNDILVKVVARALTEHPLLNSSLTAEGILLKGAINMGLAVSVENGLIVPVIPDADRLSLPEIAAKTAELAEKARKGELQPAESSGGTFTITNLGMFDVDEFTAIINPPESAILAIGKIDRIPVAEGDNIVIRPILVLSLTYDHRIIDGAPAAQFLQRVKQILQNPYLLI